MSKAAAKTGSGPTALVAVEQSFPLNERILTDELAGRILPFGMNLFSRTMSSPALRDWMVGVSEKEAPGIWSGMMCRKCYIDEKLNACAPQVNAVVNLGAGFDTRAYRLACLAALPVWEVDQPENIALKQELLGKALRAVPEHVHLVGADFDREDLGAALKGHGYDIAARTFFIMEAVTQYLTEQGIRDTFDFLAKAECGSRLVFTYVQKAFLDGRMRSEWEEGYAKYVGRKIWLFGMEPKEWPPFLARYGWKLIEDADYESLHEKYVRPTGRILSSSPIERIIFAEKE